MSESGVNFATVVVASELSVKAAAQLMGESPGCTFVHCDGSNRTFGPARDLLRRFRATKLLILGPLQSFSLMSLRDDAEHWGIDIEERPLAVRALA